MGTLSALDRSGDTKLVWTPGNADEVKAAKDMFKSLRDKGFTAYSVDKKGNKSELITEFDANLTAIIMTPRMVGG